LPVEHGHKVSLNMFHATLNVTLLFKQHSNNWHKFEATKLQEYVLNSIPNLS